MGELKTTCKKCGGVILQRTADERDGMCVPCYGKIAAIVPDDFELPAEVVERIYRIHASLTMLREEAWYRGIEPVLGFLDQLDKRESLYQIWLPRLREFATACRTANPYPQDENLSVKDVAKIKIIRDKIQQSRFDPSHRSSLRTCCLPIIAIPTAERLIGPLDQTCAFLTPQEEERWREIFLPNDEDFWYHNHHWFSIEDPPRLDGSWWQHKPLVVPGDSEPWVVTFGHSTGGFGNMTIELWAWNGEQATFVKILGGLD